MPKITEWREIGYMENDELLIRKTIVIVDSAIVYSRSNSYTLAFLECCVPGVFYADQLARIQSILLEITRG